MEWTKTVLGHQQRINEQALRRAIRSGNLERIARVVNPVKLSRSIVRAVQPPIRRTVQAAGQGSARILSAHGIEATFSAAHANVVRIAREQAAELVVGVPKETRSIIAEVIARAAERGLTTLEQSRAIRELVGLPPNWAKAPAALADELTAGRAAAATSRRLSAATKQRIRSTIRRGAVTPEFVREVTAEYTRSLINLRAQTIARTETLRAAHAGTLESWVQARLQGVLPASTRKWWMVTRDERLSPEHARIPSMNPKGRRITDPFVTTEGLHQAPPSRPNCRCTVVLGFGGVRPPGAEPV